MRIAVISPPWAPVPPALYGGIELVVDRLSVGFQNAGHEVLLYATGDSTCPVPMQWVLDKAEGQRIGMAVPEQRHVMHAYEAVVEWGAEVVHDHSIVGPFHAADRYPDLPVATTIHGPFNEELTDLYERLNKDGTPIIAISHAQAASAPTVRVERVIHHGVDVKDFPVGDGKGGYCLFLGRMSPDKGPHRAIAAARKAGVPLLMAAKMREAWEIAFFEEEVHPYLSDDVQYLGEVPHEQKLELLAGATALLNPIRWNEPFGLVMIEALACGTPVLAFAEGAAPEIVNEGVTGFLCEDENDMADKIGLAPQLDRAACREAVESYFCTKRMVDEHLELFQTMLER
ncbi:MAG TPA: glycosyltransferase family 4 protein [Acidimicrobiales bacterium]|nr:glycosyltransferase family 4 protein [Acidimicrobiales bacterium]